MIASIKKIALSTVAVAAIGAATIGTANADVYYQPVYVPTCRLISVPYMNPYTGWTYFVTRQICN